MSRRILIPLLLAALMVPFAVAQDNSGDNNQGERGERGDRGERGERGERGDRGERGRGGPGGDPAQFRQRMMDNLKEQMGVTNEEEWKVIQAKLEPVMAKSMEARAGGMMGMFRGRGGRGGDDNGRQRSAVETASRDLRTLLENKDVSEDQIKQKLTAFREARDKARAELAAAQKDLKEILMPRQEAVLVQYGMIE